MNDYKWCISYIASGIDVVELQVVNRPKMAWKLLCRTCCLHNWMHR